MKVLFVHLLNNYTGSPRVLSNFLSNDFSFNVDILTSKTDGFLSNLKNVSYYWNGYKWKKNKILLSILLFFSQIKQFFFVLFRNYDCVYINTILPFGAAFAAYLKKEKVIYHIHEYYENPNIMQKFCVFIAKKTAREVIFVSRYLENCYKNSFKCKTQIVYNSVSKSFHEKAKSFVPDLNKKFNQKTLLLACSLKKYKGIYQFLEIANRCPDYRFILVVSNSKEETQLFFSNYKLPNNIEILNQVKDMGVVYEKTSVVLNLSLPYGNDRWIETFGMGLIEGFEYKIPCIAPKFGGPCEIITDGINGYLINPFEIDDIISKINNLFISENTYKKFCANTQINIFSENIFNKKIFNIILGGE